SRAVRTAFKRLYDAGLIYRGRRMVHWDPKLQTTVSDEEIEWATEVTPFYYLKYGPFVIATARPETKFGDKYVVVHPDDARYQKFRHGEKLTIEWINGPITATVIKDESIDPAFGTGAMTITPAHDLTDYEITQRHQLESEQIIDLRGKLLPIAGEFAGEHWKRVRPRLIEKLEQKGLVEKVDAHYEHRVAKNSRGGGIIEPQILEQWFVAVNKPFGEKKTTLKEVVRQPLESEQIKIIPEHFTKTYFRWIDHLHDWCISRQIWYGHRIPVWYRKEEVYVGVDAPAGPDWEQDPDTLDTWFSSGLWTFSTLGWPEETVELKTFHPTTILETGYDILFFWVARMIMLAGFLLGELPFRTVYLNGLVRDEGGKKMSKSKSNSIDPLIMIERYGADALRLALIIGTSPGGDSRISEDKIRGYKHFSNKLWNIGRFVLGRIDGKIPVRPDNLSAADETALNDFALLAQAVTDDLENYRFALAGEKLYHYVWHTLADKINEEIKRRPAREASGSWLLYTIFERCLRLLHPFTPFITEALWALLPKTSPSFLINQTWTTN
ncbi:MAG: class I tRNA ligase family protein, partial [Patescibacteria group bacterium]